MTFDPCTRRLFFQRSGIALGSAALASVLRDDAAAAGMTPEEAEDHETDDVAGNIAVTVSLPLHVNDHSCYH